MRVAFYFAAALGVVLCSGCARQKDSASPSFAGSAYGPSGIQSNKGGSNRIVTPGAGFEGKVAWVNPNLRFVVVTFPPGQMPALDRRFGVYRKGLKIGEVKVTGPQRDDSIVGDIVAGEAGPGDVVRDR